MRGDEWNTLVSAPSGTEIDAALAEVRVRAVPIARRNARNRRAISFAFAALALGGSFMAGGMSASNGVRVGAEPIRFSPGYRGAPELTVGPPLASAMRADSTVTYRISGWTEWDGVRYDEGESYVTGPSGTGFALALDDTSGALHASVQAAVSPDSVVFLVSSFRRLRLGLSRRNLDVYEEGHAYGRKAVPRGRSLLLYPNGRGGEGPQPIIEIDGPDITAPRAAPWREKGGLQLSYHETRFRDLGSDIAWRMARAKAVGVRVAMTHVGGIYPVGLHWSPIPSMRFNVAGRRDYGQYTAGGVTQRVIIPGVRDTVFVSAWSNNGVAFCFNLSRLKAARAAADRAAGEAPFSASGCFSDTDNWAPIDVTANNGQAIHVEMTPVERARSAGAGLR